MLDAGINDRIKDITCPLEASLAITSGRWKPLIIYNLNTKDLRYSELKAVLPNPSDRMLSRSLKEMIRDGLVVRNVLDDTPVQVTYGLTLAGRDLVPALEAMLAWAVKYWNVGKS